MNNGRPFEPQLWRWQVLTCGGDAVFVDAHGFSLNNNSDLMFLNVGELHPDAPPFAMQGTLIRVFRADYWLDVKPIERLIG